MPSSGLIKLQVNTERFLSCQVAQTEAEDVEFLTRLPDELSQQGDRR